MKQLRRPRVLIGLVLLTVACMTLQCQRDNKPNNTDAAPFTSDPVRGLGHGAFFDGEGNEFTPEADYIERAQSYYIEAISENLLKNDVSGDELKKVKATIYESVEDVVLANALYLDWLLEKETSRRKAHYVMVNNALRWYYVLNYQKNGLLPEEEGDGLWAKGLEFDLAKKLEEGGIRVFLETKAGGARYIEECQKADVPVPDAMFTDEWTKLGTFDNEFISEDEEAELWIYRSTDPPGVCLALPRYFIRNGQVTDDIDLLGIICLGTQSNNACFFDNPRYKTFRRNQRIPITDFVGGVDLIANGQGICSDCHAGENPYVVHPDKPPFAAVQNELRSPGWHRPLVDASWPQNPGPSNLLDAIPSTKSCSGCHSAGRSGGRFPDISSELPEYCEFVLDSAIGPLPERTMPQGDLNRIALYQNHINALKRACGLPPSGGGVVVETEFPDDDGYISAPIVIGPLYACATGLSVRGAILDAEVSLWINGVEKAVISPARNPDRLEFTGLDPLQVGDVVTAIQKVDGTTSPSASAVTVRDHRVDYPNGLPAPTIDPDLVYECASVIAVRHVPGAKVTVYTNGADPVSFESAGDWTMVRPGKTPFDVGDEFTAEISLCNDRSPTSAKVKAVTAPAALPQAALDPVTPYEGQELVTIRNLTHGSSGQMVEANAGQIGRFSTPISWLSNYDVATRLGRPLANGDRLMVNQRLCDQGSRTPIPETADCESLPAPKIKHPLVGETYVVVEEFVPGARIRVYDNNGTELGDGSGTVVLLRRAITAADVLTVTQQVGKCVGKSAYRISVRYPESLVDK